MAIETDDLDEILLLLTLKRRGVDIIDFSQFCGIHYYIKDNIDIVKDLLNKYNISKDTLLDEQHEIRKCMLTGCFTGYKQMKHIFINTILDEITEI